MCPWWLMFQLCSVDTKEAKSMKWYLPNKQKTRVIFIFSSSRLRFKYSKYLLSYHWNGIFTLYTVEPLDEGWLKALCETSWVSLRESVLFCSTLLVSMFCIPYRITLAYDGNVDSNRRKMLNSFHTCCLERDNVNSVIVVNVEYPLLWSDCWCFQDITWILLQHKVLIMHSLGKNWAK